MGLKPESVVLLQQTSDWLKYDIPEHLIRKNVVPRCIGQKQMWFLLRLTAADSAVSLQGLPVDEGLDGLVAPEFDQWQWVDPKQPELEVIEFKRDVYRQAIAAFAGFLTAPC